MFAFSQSLGSFSISMEAWMMVANAGTTWDSAGTCSLYNVASLGVWYLDTKRVFFKGWVDWLFSWIVAVSGEDKLELLHHDFELLSLYWHWPAVPDLRKPSLYCFCAFIWRASRMAWSCSHALSLSEWHCWCRWALLFLNASLHCFWNVLKERHWLDFLFVSVQPGFTSRLL